MSEVSIHNGSLNQNICSFKCGIWHIFQCDKIDHSKLFSSHDGTITDICKWEKCVPCQTFRCENWFLWKGVGNACYNLAFLMCVFFNHSYGSPVRDNSYVLISLCSKSHKYQRRLFLVQSKIFQPNIRWT